jgi:hypothetical protein
MRSNRVRVLGGSFSQKIKEKSLFIFLLVNNGGKRLIESAPGPHLHLREAADGVRPDQLVPI